MSLCIKIYASKWQSHCPTSLHLLRVELCFSQGAHSMKRRDDLLQWQRHFQAIWEQEKLFEANAPAEGVWSLLARPPHSATIRILQNNTDQA